MTETGTTTWIRDYDGRTNPFCSMLQICIADQTLDAQDVVRLYIAFLQGFKDITNAANAFFSYHYTNFGLRIVLHTLAI